MHLVYDWLFTVMWIAFLIYWQVMAINTKATTQLEPTASRALRVLLFGTAIVLLSFRVPVAWLHVHLWPSNFDTFWTGAAITIAGLLFCVWARVTLGRNWSRSVTIKQDHELIVSGPYALVRHPIYSGLFLGFIGTLLAMGQVRGVVAFGLIVLALWIKLRLEEKWMRAQFGAKYEAYAGRVKAVVPGVL
jgi:protein-S-isoprenylcysteine O-methyltransferase Ste14